MKLSPVALVAALVLSVAPPGSAEPPYGTRYDALVAMTDEVRLDASLFVPPGAVKTPLIVRQHGGGSNKDNAYDVGYGMAAVERGYAVLLYSHRGHGNSEGLFDFFGPRTTLDFSEMLDWVESVAGAAVDTNNVGTSGYSQGGGESLLPAGEDPRVKAVAVGQTFADLSHALNPNDCFKLSWATGIFAAAYKASASRTQDDLAVRWGATWYTDTEDVAGTTDEVRARSPVAYLDEFIERRLPIFWTQAWEDQLFPGDHPEMVLEPLGATGVPVHYWFSSGGHARGANFPEEETARESAMLDWFDEHLRGIDHGLSSGPEVTYWERVEPGTPGVWTRHDAAEWPIAADVEPWSALSDGRLARVDLVPDMEIAQITNDYAGSNVANDDILNEIWGQSAGRVPGMGDQLRHVPENGTPVDTATFTSEPLEAPVRVVGAPLVEVWGATTAATVAQVAAKVWDRGADGSARLVWRGCRSFEGEALGQIERSLPLWPNAHTFAAGHRIVLQIAATDMPMFKADREPAVTRIRTGTSLRLPVVP